MGFKIHYKANKDLPKLAWLATVDHDRCLVEVIHGRSVECKDDWMVEGVWDDDFKEGNFHRSENFFGSGIRIENGKVYFVSSSALVDRLMFCEDDDRIIVSNSLILLLAFTGATLDSNHDYHRESLSIEKGVKKYDKEFAVIHSRIKCFYQVFYENIVVSKNEIRFRSRDKHHKIESFDQYYKMLTEILQRIKHNYQSDLRKNRVSTFTTISSGYDSTAVSCLAKDLGVTTCFTGHQLNRPNILSYIRSKSEDGTPIAKTLGLDIRHLDARRNSITEDELYFLSINYPKFSTDSLLQLGLYTMTAFIEKNCSIAVVFTGFHGDKIWDVNPKEKYLIEDFGVTTGLHLTEIRLKSGFINVAIPYILAKCIKDIVKIAQAPEMQPWRLGNSYDRPIARRIAEDVGVNRRFFGMKKVMLADRQLCPVNRYLRKEFFYFLKKKLGIGPMYVYTYCTLMVSANLAQSMLTKIGFNLKIVRRLFSLTNLDVPFLMCHWATHKLAKRTARVLCKKPNL
jgi:hypothetical protein